MCAPHHVAFDAAAIDCEKFKQQCLQSGAHSPCLLCSEQACMHACHLIVIKLIAPCLQSVALPVALGRLSAALSRHTAALSRCTAAVARHSAALGRLSAALSRHTAALPLVDVVLPLVDVVLPLVDLVLPLIDVVLPQPKN